MFFFSKNLVSFMMIHTSNFLEHFSMKKKLHCEPIKSETHLENVKGKVANVLSIQFLHFDASLSRSLLCNLIRTEETIRMYIGEIYGAKHSPLSSLSRRLSGMNLTLHRFYVMFVFQSF